jgi:hypothetical protein
MTHNMIICFYNHEPDKEDLLAFERRTLSDLNDGLVLVDSVDQGKNPKAGIMYAHGVAWYQVLYGVAHCPYWEEVTFVSSEGLEVRVTHTWLRDLLTRMPRVFNEVIWWMEFNKRLP